MSALGFRRLARRCASTTVRQPMLRLAKVAVPSTPPVQFVCPWEVIRTSVSVRSQSNFHNVMQAELEEEEKQAERAQTPTIPSGWELKHKTGDSYFTLSKTHHDEKLDVFCQLPDEARGAPAEDGGNEPQEYAFTLTIDRRGKAMEFHVSAIDAELVINGLMMHDDVKTVTDHTANGTFAKDRKYHGPNVAELNAQVVDEMIAFLSSRGVDDDFAAFVGQYAYWKEQHEYENWLRQVTVFTKA